MTLHSGAGYGTPTRPLGPVLGATSRTPGLLLVARKITRLDRLDLTSMFYPPLFFFPFFENSKAKQAL